MVCQMMSKTNNAIAKKKIVKITTIEARINSSLVGHVTLFISASTAIKKSANRGQLTSRYPIQSPAASKTPGIAVAIPADIDPPSVAYNRQQPSATTIQITSAVIWRTIRPWLGL